MLPTEFPVNWPFGSGEEAKNWLSRWQPSWISDPNDFSYFWPTSHPDDSYQVSINWPFGSGEEVKNRFSRWQPSWISKQNNFSYFRSTSHPNVSYQVSSQLAQGCRRSRLLKQLLMAHDGRSMTNDGHWLTTIAHLQNFMLRLAKNAQEKIAAYLRMP